MLLPKVDDVLCSGSRDAIKMKGERLQVHHLHTFKNNFNYTSAINRLRVHEFSRAAKSPTTDFKHERSGRDMK